MLSIQYVYERVLLILIPFSISASQRSFSKRVQKYNFFFNSQAFSKKNFFLFPKPTNPKSQASSYFHSFRFGWAKILSFPFIKQAFLKLFFQLFLFLIIRTEMRFMLSKCVAVVAGAKVEKFLLLPNLFSSFFYFPFKGIPLFIRVKTFQSVSELLRYCECKSSTFFRSRKL
jgi:hypothetical protein